MFKKIIPTSLLIIFCLSINFLSGHSELFRCYHYPIEYRVDFDSLLSEGHEIDLKASEFAQNKLHGWYYDHEIHAVVPNDINQTDEEWKKTKDKIARVIGPLPSYINQDYRSWKNSAKTVDELIQDASIMAPSFIKDFEHLASLTGTKANFGPNNQYAMKSRASLINKVKRDSNEFKISDEEAVTLIGDALRGTLILNDLSQIPTVVAEIINYAKDHDARVTFKNLWAEDRESGYVGIHAKLLLPLHNSEKGKAQRYILAEMQIHLYSIFDGTSESVKERGHLIYEHVRDLEDFDHLKHSAASRLLFLTAMQEVLKALDKKQSDKQL